MAVYVDPLRVHPAHRLPPHLRVHGLSWCHLFADGPEELQQFARTIGLRAEWAHRPRGPAWRVHFDLPPERRARAVAAGAVELDWRQTGRWLRARRAAAGGLRSRTVDTIDAAGVSVALEDDGDGDPCLLLLHGFAANRASWAMVAPALAERHRVLVPDRPGWGDTPLPPDDQTRRQVMGPSGEANLWLALADRLDLGPLVLVGHSAGGAVAAELALAAPERVAGLVLVDAAIGAIVEPPPSLVALARRPGINARARRLTAAVVPRAWRRLLAMTYRDPTAVRPEILETYQSTIGSPAWAETVWETARLVEPGDLHERVADLQVPTLILSGRHDHVVPPGVADHLADRIPRAHLVLVAGAGHNPHEERPAEVVAALAPFLAQVSAPTTSS